MHVGDSKRLGETERGIMLLGEEDVASKRWETSSLSSSTNISAYILFFSLVPRIPHHSKFLFQTVLQPSSSVSCSELLFY